MMTKKQILSRKDSLLDLKGLVEVYEEIAAGRMQSIRGAVIQSRQFLEGLLDVFKRVKRVYKGQVQRGNGEEVAVFISANSGLYGNIVEQTCEMFEEYVTRQNCEIVVLGKLGVRMMQDRLPTRLYNYYDFSDDGVDVESFELVIRYLLQFERILIFYGQFKTILNQNPVATSISGDLIEAESSLEDDRIGIKKSYYLFEPSVGQIAKLFEGEILASLFEQTLHESQLSKFASRMLSLDRSMDSIEKDLNQVRFDQQKISHRLINDKQQGTIAGMTLWR